MEDIRTYVAAKAHRSRSNRIVPNQQASGNKNDVPVPNDHDPKTVLVYRTELRG